MEWSLWTRRARAYDVAKRLQRFLEDLAGDLTGGGVSGGVLAVDFHLEDTVGGIKGAGLGVSQQSDHALLEGAETELDLLPLA